MVIRVEPMGGLGNQLFIYAAGKALSARQGVPLVVDRRAYRDIGWPHFELDSFASQFLLEDSDPGDEIRALRGFRIRRRLRLSTLEFSSKWGLTYTEKSFRFDPRVLELGDNYRLRGYFQSWKYSVEIRDILAEELTSLLSPSEWYITQAKRLREMDPWIGLQIRRGDYVGNKFMGIAGRDYFLRSLELLTSLTGVQKVLVFSDQPELVADELGSDFGFHYEVISAPHSSRPIESLNLLSLASHLCISNSTFGWWAAWLGDKAERTVVVPRPWVDMTRFDDFSLHPPEWISVGR